MVCVVGAFDVVTVVVYSGLRNWKLEPIGTIAKLMNKNIANVNGTVRTHESATDMAEAAMTVLNYMKEHFHIAIVKLGCVTPDGAAAAQLAGKLMFREYKLYRGKVLRCWSHKSHKHSEKAFANAPIRQQVIDSTNAFAKHVKESMFEHDLLHKQCQLVGMTPRNPLSINSFRWADYAMPIKRMCELHTPAMLSINADYKTGKIRKFREQRHKWKVDCEEWVSNIPTKIEANSNKSREEMNKLMGIWKNNQPIAPQPTPEVKNCMFLRLCLVSVLVSAHVFLWSRALISIAVTQLFVFFHSNSNNTS